MLCVGTTAAIAADVAATIAAVSAAVPAAAIAVAATSSFKHLIFTDQFPGSSFQPRCQPQLD